MLDKLSPTTDPIIAVENSIEIASIFIGVEPKLLEQFPLQTIKKIHDKLMFLSKKPEPLKKTKFNWIKKLDDPTYDTYITYVKVSEQLSNGDFSQFPLIIKSICLDNLTDEEVMNLPMDEVETGFFLLRKSLKKFLEPTINTLTTQEMKRRFWQKMKNRKIIKTL